MKFIPYIVAVTLLVGGGAFIKRHYALQGQMEQLERIVEAQKIDLEASYAQAAKIRVLERRTASVVSQLEAGSRTCLDAADTNSLRSLWAD